MTWNGITCVKYVGEIPEIAELKKPSAETLHLLERLSRNEPPVTTPRIPGITCLLQSALSPRRIDLTFRPTPKNGPFYTAQYNRIIESIVHETEFPLREEFTLSGFPANEESILVFLHKHPGIRSFTLRECFISVSWASIFSHLESMPKLEDFNLSNLFGKNENGADGYMVNLPRSI